MAAHDIPYVATVSVGYPEDFIAKVVRARDMGPGFKYIHIQAPCPTGWRFPEKKTVEMARLAVETGFFILYEVENGRFRITRRPAERKPVEAFLKAQGRFAALNEAAVNTLQRWVDEKWEELDSQCR
jgi:pyruvate ferredoxin oxidoreductase beta subunit